MMMMSRGKVFKILPSIQCRQVGLCDCFRILSPFGRPEFFSTEAEKGQELTQKLDVKDEDGRPESFSIEAEKGSESTQRLDETDEKEVGVARKPSVEVFRKWGCTESDIEKIYERAPSLRRADGSTLESKLQLLGQLGLQASDIVKIINCRPRFLSSRINKYFDGRIDELRSLFGSTELFLKAIVRNPSLLTYDFNRKVKPVILLYEQLGINKDDLISMLLLRPTLIHRTSLTEEKLEYIRRTGISKESKMYKYVVSIMAVSRLETLREKIANLERFGLSEDEVLELFGRYPILMTLSLEKVQRNMVFVIGTMKFPAKIVIEYPFLLLNSLEVLLKPRFLLASKIQDMDLTPQIKGPYLFRALRMSEQRFLDAYVTCHEEDIRDELLDYYRRVKRIKRLAAASKKATYTSGFPF